MPTTWFLLCLKQSPDPFVWLMRSSYMIYLLFTSLLPCSPAPPSCAHNFSQFLEYILLSPFPHMNCCLVQAVLSPHPITVPEYLLIFEILDFMLFLHSGWTPGFPTSIAKFFTLFSVHYCSHSYALLLISSLIFLFTL